MKFYNQKDRIMSRPNIISLEKLELINNKINELYEKKRELTTKLIEKYGPNEFTYELNEPTEKGEKFVKYKLIDNLEDFISGKPMYKGTAFERYSYECRYLKREPK